MNTCKGILYSKSEFVGQLFISAWDAESATTELG